MYFQKRLNCNSAEWQFVDHEALLAIVDNADVDLMIWQKATITVGSYQYRRYIPAIIPDWAEISGEKQKFMTAEVSA